MHLGYANLLQFKGAADQAKDQNKWLGKNAVEALNSIDL